MIIQSISQFGILLIYESGLLGRLGNISGKRPAPRPSAVHQQQVDTSIEEANLSDVISKDSDVLDEEMRIEQLLTNSANTKDLFVVDKLTKQYRRLLAVKGISFSLDKNECFGLLGIHCFHETHYSFKFSCILKVSFSNTC